LIITSKSKQNFKKYFKQSTYSLKRLYVIIGAVLLLRNVFSTFYEFHYLGYVLDIENRPIENANVADELSSSITKSIKNGSYELSVEEG